MFGRQWFRPGSQVALSNEAVELEGIVRKRFYKESIHFAASKLKHSHSVEASYWRRQIKRIRRLQARNCVLPYYNKIRIGYSGFWNGFDPENNEILNLLSHACVLAGFEAIVDLNDPDITVCSCFNGGENPKINEDTTRLLYLGENVRPDYSYVDYSLTFDFSSYCGKNIYTPLWILRSNKYAISGSDYEPYDKNDLESAKTINSGVNSIAYIGNNSTAMRIEAISELRKLGFQIDEYGSHTRPVDSKKRVLKNYRYSLCFENSYTPGYTTEKIIDSFVSGTIPIYWGGAPKDIFNENAYFSFCPFLSVNDNTKNFNSWHQQHLHRKMNQPLLKSGGFARTELRILKPLINLLIDLF